MENLVKCFEYVTYAFHQRVYQGEVRMPVVAVVVAVVPVRDPCVSWPLKRGLGH